MYPTVTNRATSHAQRLRQRRAPARKRQLGQTLVIFALSVTVLLGLASLAIDAMRAYDLYAREERAAEAGALAGVLYMPCAYDSKGPNPAASSTVACSTTTSPDGLTAQQRALQEVQKNGFGTSLTVGGMPDGCIGSDTTAEVTVCGVTNRTSALQVTISEPITAFFLFTSVSGNSSQSFMVTATAGADYLNAYVLGNDPTSSNSNGWGDGGRNNPKNFVAVINGPAEYKETGDPWVYCEEGPSNGPLNPAQYSGMVGPTGADISLYQPTSPNPLQILGQYGATTGNIQTNHPQYPSGPACGAPGSAQVINGGNPDQQPPGFDGPDTAGTVHDGAANYAIYVPPANSGLPGATGQATVWIWNPDYNPTDPSNSCTGLQQLDQFPLDTGCNVYYQNYGITTNPNPAAKCLTPIAPNYCPMIQLNSTTPGTAYMDDPRLYFTMRYSLYATNGTSPGGPANIYEATKQYTPNDMISNDLTRHGCTTNAYDPAQDNSYYNTPNTVTPGTNGGKGCKNNPLNASSFGSDWDPIGTVGAGLHRLAVEASPYTQTSGPNPACSTQNAICGWGRHTYAILVCAPSTPGALPSVDVCPNGTAAARVSAWNNMDVYTNFPKTGPQSNNIPLAYIDARFAGHTIEIGLFNPAKAHQFGANTWFIIVPPDCTVNPSGTPLQYGSGDGAGHQQAAWARTAPYPITPPNSLRCQDTTSMETSVSNGPSNASDSIYNGLWIWTRITLPANYGGGEWYMDEHSANGKDFNEFSVAFRLDDPSPVHIIF